MKKRNKPILMATLLVCFIAAAVGMNAMSSESKSLETEAPHQEEPAKLGESRKEDTTAAATDAAKKFGAPSAKGTTAPRAMTPDGPTGPPMGIVKPKADANSYKPKPNDSSTNAGWYRKEFGYKGGGKG